MHGYVMKLSLVIFLAVLAGCGSSQATVQGWVTGNGKDIDEGEISFMPVDDKNPTAGASITKGRFCARLNPGKYVAMVTGGGKAPEFPKSQAEMKSLPAKGIVCPDQVPSQAAGNGQTIEVKAGGQELNISLRYPAQRK